MARVRRSIVLGTVATAAAAVVLGGPLDPPAGPVTSTYKTLTEVEPRIAISPVNTAGDANSLFKIAQPGSYYLTGNVTGVVGKHGIEIASGGVTLDLMGFDLLGVPGSLDGINLAVSASGVSVANGSFRGWGGEGVDLQSADAARVHDLRAVANAGAGILAGNNAAVTACVADSNGGAGIGTGSLSVVSGCSVRVSGGHGISTATNCTITGCSASFSTLDGIRAGAGNVVTGCGALSNTGNGISVLSTSVLSGCTARSNTGHGFLTSVGVMISDCVAQFNTLDGINVNGDCTVRGNTCDSNGAGAGDGAGIHAISADTRIEGNNCTGNDRGIDVDAAGNVIVKNTCSGNTTNWVIVANNVCGPILDRTAPASAAISGNSAPDSTGSTHPNANFTY